MVLEFVSGNFVKNAYIVLKGRRSFTLISIVGAAECVYLL